LFLILLRCLSLSTLATPSSTLFPYTTLFRSPSHILVAFDAGKTTFRHATYQEYKGGREKTPPELSEQFPVVKELLDNSGGRKRLDRKSTRLNSSHVSISYAVFCLKTEKEVDS